MDTEKNKNNKKGRRSFVVALIILLLLTLFSGILLTDNLIDYVMEDDKEVMLQTNYDEYLELFEISYSNDAGEVTVMGTDGQKVVAPGTSVEYTIRLRNTENIALDYILEPRVEFTSEYEIPIEVRMIDEDMNYLLGDATTWVPIADMNAVTAERTILKGESEEYIFQWRWVFESGNDEYDTLLGSSAVTQEVGLEVSVRLQAAANTSVEVNGGPFETELGDVLVIGFIVFLLLLAIILLLISAARRKKAQVQAAEQQELDNLMN